MTTTIERRIFNSAAIWTVLGLLSGLGYRELTRTLEFTGKTQLAVAHTHALVLGTVMLLIVLLLTRVFSLATDERLGYLLGFWNAGLALTFGMLVTKGTLQVLGNELANHKAVAGVSGLGHILLAGSFVVLFLIVRKGLGSTPTPAAEVAPASVS